MEGCYSPQTGKPLLLQDSITFSLSSAVAPFILAIKDCLEVSGNLSTKRATSQSPREGPAPSYPMVL